MTTFTVEEVRHRAQALEHRVVLLRQLLTELEVRYGRLAPDGPDLLMLGDRYELPRRDVVDDLRGDLIRAQAQARAAYAVWVGREFNATEDDDTEPMEDFG